MQRFEHALDETDRIVDVATAQQLIGGKARQLDFSFDGSRARTLQKRLRGFPAPPQVTEGVTEPFLDGARIRTLRVKLEAEPVVLRGALEGEGRHGAIAGQDRIANGPVAIPGA